MREKRVLWGNMSRYDRSWLRGLHWITFFGGVAVRLLSEVARLGAPRFGLRLVSAVLFCFS